MSIMFERKIFTTSIMFERLFMLELTFIKAISRETALCISISCTFITSTNLFNCLVICSITVSSPGATIVILETVGSSVVPTVKLSILYPLRLNSPEILLRTPKWFSTVIDKTCFFILKTSLL